MSNHLIAEVLEIESEADTIVRNAKQKAEKIIAGIHHEIGCMKAIIENEYRQKLETLKSKTLDLQKSEEERLRNEFKLLKKNLLHRNNQIVQDAVNWVVKNIYES
ncbi:MAG: hypothetical protein E3K36_02520 [Candidatus Brocadia sp.]|nr:hypothetical protein [Candidatus Brocadia sp.]